MENGTTQSTDALEWEALEPLWAELGEDGWVDEELLKDLSSLNFNDGELQVAIDQHESRAFSNVYRANGRPLHLIISARDLKPGVGAAMRALAQQGGVGEEASVSCCLMYADSSTPVELYSRAVYPPYIRLLGAESCREKKGEANAWEGGAMSVAAGFTLSSHGTSKEHREGPRSPEEARNHKGGEQAPWLATEFLCDNSTAAVPTPVNVSTDGGRCAVEITVRTATNISSKSLAENPRKDPPRPVYWQVDVEATAADGDNIKLTGRTDPFVYLPNLPKARDTVVASPSTSPTSPHPIAELRLDEVVMDDRPGCTRVVCIGASLGSSNSDIQCILVLRDGRELQLPREQPSAHVYITSIPDQEECHAPDKIYMVGLMIYMAHCVGGEQVSRTEAQEVRSLL